MAATDVYAKATLIPVGDAPQGSGKNVETVTFLDNSSASSAGIRLNGGKYAVDVIGATFGTVTMQKLSPDGTNYVGVGSGTFSASGTVSLDLSYGTYKMVLG